MIGKLIALFTFIALMYITSKSDLFNKIEEECLKLHDENMIFSNDYLSYNFNQSRELKWRSKITPGLFYAVVKFIDGKRNVTDIMDLSDNNLDGSVYNNLQLLVQKVLTDDNQCPCGKGTILVPSQINCDDLLGCPFDKAFIDVYHNAKDELFLMSVRYDKTTCAVSAQDHTVKKQLGAMDNYHLLDESEDNLESTRKGTQVVSMTFKSFKMQKHIKWSNVTAARYTVKIKDLQGAFLKGSSELEFDLCKPPKPCSAQCPESALIQIVYELYFGGPVQCPLKNIKLHKLNSFVDVKYAAPPKILRCEPSEFKIEIFENGASRSIFGLEAVPTPCDKFIV